GIRDGHVTGVQTCALPISFFDGQIAAGLHGKADARKVGKQDQPVVCLTQWQAASPVERPAAQAAPGPGRPRPTEVRRPCVPSLSQYVPAELHGDSSRSLAVLDGSFRRGHVRPLRQDQIERGVSQRNGREGRFGFRTSVQNHRYWTEWTENRKFSA